MSIKRKLAGTVLSVAAIAAFAGAAVTFSAFTATTENPNNSFKAGTVALTDNDSGAALFALTNMKPADPKLKCLTVDYTGSLASKIKLYATKTTSAADKDLAPYANVRITRGTGTADADCNGFVADAGAPLYDGTLAALGSDYAGGVQDATTFNTGDKAVYQVKVDVQDTNDAQGKDANATLTFEARNI
jgi:predicted ribosomally synthesized peptide with SipW-like signal peptide